MERYKAEIMPYAEMQEEVLRLRDSTPSQPGGTTTYDIVVPDTSEAQRGTPGLVAMYNPSSGLRLDGNDRICIAAATEQEIDDINKLGATPSVNKPIVPHTLKYAVRAASFKGDIEPLTETSTDTNTPAGALAVKKFVHAREGIYDAIIKAYISDQISGVEDSITNSHPVIKRAKIRKDGTFEIKPGTIAIIFPWNDADFYDPSDSPIVTGKASLVFATHRYNPTDDTEQNDTISDTGTHYEVSIITFSGITAKSSHSSYRINTVNGQPKYCYFKNDAGSVGFDETGLAYITYVTF